MRIVVMPMAGLGTRFSEVFHDKKLAPIPPDNDPMFIYAIKKLGFHYDLLCLLPQSTTDVESVLRHYPEISKKTEIIPTDGVTSGPLDTVIYAKPILEANPEAELVICNCDQVLIWPGDWALNWFLSRGAVGGIPTIERKSARHSFAAIDSQYPFKITKVREKEKISDRATIGVYWFLHAGAFLKAADYVFQNKDTAPNGEYYVSHVYNYLAGLKLEYPLCEFWSLGEPENYQNYIDKNYTLGVDA